MAWTCYYNQLFLSVSSLHLRKMTAGSRSLVSLQTLLNAPAWCYNWKEEERKWESEWESWRKAKTEGGMEGREKWVHWLTISWLVISSSRQPCRRLLSSAPAQAGLVLSLGSLCHLAHPLGHPGSAGGSWPVLVVPESSAPLSSADLIYHQVFRLVLETLWISGHFGGFLFSLFSLNTSAGIRSLTELVGSQSFWWPLEYITYRFTLYSLSLS